MKIVIDIPEDMYKDASILIVKDFPELKKAIVNGTPYEERPTGNWIFHKDYDESCKYGCTQCGNLNNISSNFCPNCGADMRGGKND